MDFSDLNFEEKFQFCHVFTEFFRNHNKLNKSIFSGRLKTHIISKTDTQYFSVYWLDKPCPNSKCQQRKVKTWKKNIFEFVIGMCKELSPVNDYPDLSHTHVFKFLGATGIDCSSK